MGADKLDCRRFYRSRPEPAAALGRLHFLPHAPQLGQFPFDRTLRTRSFLP
jgi:hypothetical protein